MSLVTCTLCGSLIDSRGYKNHRGGMSCTCLKITAWYIKEGWERGFSGGQARMLLHALPKKLCSNDIIGIVPGSIGRRAKFTKGWYFKSPHDEISLSDLLNIAEQLYEEPDRVFPQAPSTKRGCLMLVLSLHLADLLALAGFLKLRTLS